MILLPAGAVSVAYNYKFLPRPFSLQVRKWRNWQTRKPQELVAARSWGFESPLPHHDQKAQQRSPFSDSSEHVTPPAGSTSFSRPSSGTSR
jgi:hypothetical protein